MKKIILLTMALFCFGTMTMYADKAAKDVRKDRLELQKMKTKDLKKILQKEIDSEYRKLTSAGWRSKAGESSFRNSLEDAWTLEHEYDNELYPRAFIAEGTAMGKDFELAREKAIAQAKNNLVDAVQKELKLMLEWAEQEKKVRPQDTKVVRASLVNIMRQLSEQIQEINVIVELSGAQGANNEILVRVSCSGSNLIEMARTVVRTDLREKGETYLADRVSIIFNWRESTKIERVK